MAKVWINPAFKDKLPEQVKQKEETSVSKDSFKKPGFKKQEKFERKRTPIIKKEPDALLELKFLQYLMEKSIPIEIKLIEGMEFKGKIKWFSEWMMGLESDNEKHNIMFNRLMMLYYRQLKDLAPSEKEIEGFSLPDIGNIEAKVMQKFKDEKTPLYFYLKNNTKLEGTLEWFEKLIYHVRSIDGKEDYNIYKASILYFEEVSSK
jgi:sRNA-binding regulator protein Hfq